MNRKRDPEWLPLREKGGEEGEDKTSALILFGFTVLTSYRIGFYEKKEIAQ